MNCVIRKLEPSDRKEWDRLWTGYLEFYETSVESEVYDATFNRLLGDDSGDFNCLVADKGGKPVGLAHYLFHRHCWKIEDVCYLQDLFVDLPMRGTGIGRKLIEAVYREADQIGSPAVYWLTQEFNSEARQLYDRVANVTPFIRYNR